MHDWWHDFTDIPNNLYISCDIYDLNSSKSTWSIYGWSCVNSNMILPIYSLFKEDHVRKCNNKPFLRKTKTFFGHSETVNRFYFRTEGVHIVGAALVVFCKLRLSSQCNSDCSLSCLEMTGNPALRQGKPGSGVGIGYGLRFKSQIGHFQVDYAMNSYQQRTVYFNITNVSSWMTLASPSKNPHYDFSWLFF